MHDLEIARLLVDYGASLDSVNSHTEAIIHKLDDDHTTIGIDALDFLETLSYDGFDAVDSGGRTASWSAGPQGALKAFVKLLILGTMPRKYLAAIGEPSRDRDTIVHAAAFGGNFAILSSLIHRYPNFTNVRSTTRTDVLD